MVDFLSDFLSYFFPDIANYPTWIIVFIGIVLMDFVFRVVCSLFHSFGGSRI